MRGATKMSEINKEWKAIEVWYELMLEIEDLDEIVDISDITTTVDMNHYSNYSQFDIRVRGNYYISTLMLSRAVKGTMFDIKDIRYYKHSGIKISFTGEL